MNHFAPTVNGLNVSVWDVVKRSMMEEKNQAEAQSGAEVILIPSCSWNHRVTDKQSQSMLQLQKHIWELVLDWSGLLQLSLVCL